MLSRFSRFCIPWSITASCLSISTVPPSVRTSALVFFITPNKSLVQVATSSLFFIQASKRVFSQIPTENDSNKNMPSSSCVAAVPTNDLFDEQYPGTAVQRLQSVHQRVRQLVAEDRLSNRPWEDIRRELLWAGGLRDLSNVLPGKGYTGHSFNDYNHVDLTTMNDEQTFNENRGEVKGIALGNKLGEGIRIASLPELGPGGSWSTCANGCNLVPPQDVAHIQFRSRIAFKLVWVPTRDFDSFVLVDDDGNLLAHGKPSPAIGDELPSLMERAKNYRLVKGSKYAKAADSIAMGVATE